MWTGESQGDTSGQGENRGILERDENGRKKGVRLTEVFGDIYGNAEAIIVVSKA